MAKKTKLPKKIGGVKIGKKLRKAGGKLIEQASSPIGREMIAAGLSMAASAAAAGAKRERDRQASARRATAANEAGATAEPGPSAAASARPASAAPPSAKAPPGGSADPHDIGVALGHLAQDVLGKLFAKKS